MKIKFRNGINGTLVDWTPDACIYNMDSLKRRLESSKKGEAGIIVFDNVNLTLEYKEGNNTVYNAFNGDLNAVQKYIFELHGEKSTGQTSKLFEGLTDFSSINWMDEENKISFDILDKLKAFDILNNTGTQKADLQDAIHLRTGYNGNYGIGISQVNLSGIGECWALPAFTIKYVNYTATPDQLIAQNNLLLEKGDIFQHPNAGHFDNGGVFQPGLGKYLVIDSGFTSVNGVQTTWIKVFPAPASDFAYDPPDYEFFIPKLIFHTKAYYDETDICCYKIDSYDRNVVYGFDSFKIIKAIVEGVWNNITIVNQTSHSEFPINPYYYLQLIDEDPFGKHPLDAIKYLADSILCYIYFNKEGNLVLKERSNIASGTLRSLPASKKKGGCKRKYFWDKLVDAVTVTVSSGKTNITDVWNENTTYSKGAVVRASSAVGTQIFKSLINYNQNHRIQDDNGSHWQLIDNDILTGQVTLSKNAGINPRNELKVEVIAPPNDNSNELLQGLLNDYALTIAQDLMAFYGMRHFYYDYSTFLTDEMYDWDLLDLITINGEQYFILSLEIDEKATTARFELVSTQGYDYDLEQARIPLSPANYNNTSGGNSLTSSGSGNSGSTVQIVSFTATSPLKIADSVISLDYESNFKLSAGNKFDTIQDIRITSTTFQLARVGIGGAPDTTYKLKNYGDEWITGNIKIDGVQSIGGAADTNFKLKVYGNQKITGDITVDGNLYISGSVNEVNSTELNIVDHTIKLNKSGDNITALYGGIQILGASDAMIGSIQYNGTAWLSDLNFDLASGKVYKINNVEVLNATGLGTAVVNSSLTSIGTLNHDLNIANTKVYKINGTQILSSTTLGSTVVSSSLTSVATLTTGVWHATLIDVQYGGTGANTFTKGIVASPGGTSALTTISLSDGVIPKYSSSYIAASGMTDDGTNIIFTSRGLRSSDYASQTTGWNITNAGAADFRYIYANEMHVKSFITDLEQALAGGQIISKSVAKIAADFIVPSAGNSVSLVVEEFSGFTGAVFQDGDYIRLRNVTRFSGGLQVYDCWGTVYYSGRNGSVTPSTQTYSFSRSSAPNSGAASTGSTISKGSLALDYGISGMGIYEVSAVDGSYGSNSPYAQVVQHSGHPATTQTLMGRFGNLNGSYGYSAATFGIGVGDFTKVNLTMDNANGFRLRYGSTSKISMDINGNMSISGYLQVGNAASDVNNGTTTITGSKITTGTITLTQLNFTPVQNTNVVASINASAEGIVINGAKIQINGTTTFASGYDPSQKTSSNDVTTIIGNTVTTSFLNAKNITALGAVTAGTFSLGSGAFAVDASGNLTSTSGNIGGWQITSSWLQDANQKIVLNPGNASIYARPQGSGSATKFVMLGQTYCGANNGDQPQWTGKYGISAIDGNNKWLFRLDDSYKMIAGFNFDYQKIFIGNYSAGMALNISSTPIITGNNSKGFEVYDVSNPKLFCGVRDSSGNLSAGFDWNIASSNVLTIKGNILASQFSTHNSLDLSSYLSGVIISGAHVRIANISGSLKTSLEISHQSIRFSSGSGIVGPSLLNIENGPADFINLSGFNVMKFFGVTNSPSGTNLRAGDFYIGFDNTAYIYNGSSWIQLN